VPSVTAAFQIQLGNAHPTRTHAQVGRGIILGEFLRRLPPLLLPLLLLELQGLLLNKPPKYRENSVKTA